MLKIQTSYDPEFFGWVFVEKEGGKRILKSMIDFETDRPDIHVNKYGVVLFRTGDLARTLLKMKA